MPYPQKDVATGILFGNRKEAVELSPSLNIIKDAVVNLEVPHNIINFDQTLESWESQGILLLNSALTVEMNRIGSHAMIWRPFIFCFLNNLSKRVPGLIYVLFGRQAQTFEPYINKRFNTIFKIEHPAYFARIKKDMPHKFFNDISKCYEGIYGYPIKWYNELN